MNIITIMLPFFNYCGEGFFSPISRYIVEEPKTQKTKKLTKKKKKPLKPSQKRKSNDKDSIHLREKD